MPASGFDFNAVPIYSHGPVNKYPRRIIRAVRRQPFARSQQPSTSPISSDPKDYSNCNASPYSCSVFAQILYDHYEQSGKGEIQSGVADEDGSCTSIELDALDLSENKQKNKTEQESTTNSLQLVMISRTLKGVPQSPHFYNLRNHSDQARKALICAWDRVFEEAVDQIQSLQVNGFWVNARELWKLMEELQSMGYSVIPLRRRIVELSDVISEVNLAKLEMKRLTIKAENHRAEKSRLEFVISNLQDNVSKEEEEMKRALNQVAEMENELPNIDAVFSNIFRKPLTV